MNIGIIGAENSHSAAVARALNVDKAVPGVRATHIWGETKAFAKASAERGQVPNIVARPEQLLGYVDGVMIDHRDGKHHAAAARPFIKAGVPVFVDKPMTTSLAEAKRLLKLRSECKTPLVTMSSLPHLKAIKTLRRELKKLGQLRAVRLYGPGDYRSKYGGIWFYGIHQAELMVDLLGPGARKVSMSVNGTDSFAVVNYDDALTVTMHFMMDAPHGFGISAFGHKGSFEMLLPHEPGSYVTTTRIFTKMFRTGVEPFSETRMLAPLAVLEAMAASLKRKAPVKVPKF